VGVEEILEHHGQRWLGRLELDAAFAEAAGGNF
jgi:hypothetical protein